MKQEITSPPPPPPPAAATAIRTTSTTPSRLITVRASSSSSSKPKESLKPAATLSPSPIVSTRAKSVPPSPSPPPPRDIHNITTPTTRSTTHNNQKAARRRRSLVVFNKPPKSGDDDVVAASPMGSSKFRELEEVKKTLPNHHRPVVVDQFSRPPPRQRLADPIAAAAAAAVTATKSHVVSDGLDGIGWRRRRRNETKNKDLLLEVNQLQHSDTLVQNLQSEVLELKAELDKMQALNLELLSHNTKLTQDLSAAQSKIAALSTPPHLRESVSEYQSPKFKDIQKLIASKLEHPKVIKEPSTQSTLSPAQRKVADCPTTRPPPPPPPPPLPPRSPPPPRSGPTPKAPPVVQLYHSLAKHDTKKNPLLQRNFNKPGVTNAHNSIVGEIQNRSAHLLAIKADIESKGEFINGLIQKVLAAAYTDIEDVLKFVHWLDNQLSSLSDERAVLKNFKWPERKADAMREAAIEFRGLKLLESEVSSYKDDSSIPCEVALKKMAGLLDKSERSIQRLIKLRSTVMLSYQGYKIPTDWMLDSGIICKIKQASMILVNVYMKRIILELESIRYSDRESTQEALLLQGVHFAYRAHQFAGGLDSETLCAFEEIRRRVPGHLRGCQEMLVGITSA